MSDEKTIVQGELILLTLPIGNKDDVTARVLSHINKEAYFAVEDTRVFTEWAHRFGISLEGKTVFSFHDYSPEKVYKKILSLLADGNKVCLASDAGSPIISDPAYPMIQRARSEGHSVITCPGPSSLVAALELSGFPPTPLHFYGFFPRDSKKRNQQLQAIKRTPGTYIFFESPHRVEESLSLMEQLIPDLEVAYIREITKTFQSVYRFTASQYSSLKSTFVDKGEIVLVIYNSNAKSTIPDWDEIHKSALSLLEKGCHKKSISKLLSLILDRKPSDIYGALLDHSDKE